MANMTLCWRCKHAVPNPKKGIGCSWSINLEPVPGWDAVKHYKGGFKTYCVRSCPYYTPDRNEYFKKTEDVAPVDFSKITTSLLTI